MQIYPLVLFSLINSLPESPRWFIFHDRQDDAKAALVDIYGKDEADSKHEDLKKSHEEESSKPVGYSDMLIPGRAQWHPTVVTMMGQVNQALTGYGAVSVYGPQIFELLGLGVSMAEYMTQANYVSYFLLMTFAWLLIDRVGRRILMLYGAFGISISFVIMTIVGGVAANADKLNVPQLPFTIIGGIFLFIATGLFGVCWLTQPWLIPTEIYPVTARAQGAAVSVIIWGLANFAVTLLSPIGFNNLKYWLLLIFAGTNLFAGLWTWVRQSPLKSLRRSTLTNDVTSRHTSPRPANDPLRTTSNSSSMPRSKIPGPSSTSIRVSTSVYRKVRKTGRAMANLSRC